MDGHDLTPFFALKRVHRVPAQRLQPGRPPRPVVAKLLHYRDRDLLLQTAHVAGPFMVEGRQKSIFPDFTADVQAKRATYAVVKRALREEGITYALLFPYRLKPMVDGTIHFFQDPEEAWAWLAGTISIRHDWVPKTERQRKEYGCDCPVPK
ncbi:hypothetical protein NDU88_007762 [Pleurodeles waltl]|uniref:Uncharacterized protein n=1 Tax=Pleurodeles waltl TaxID=8319 RepID=A0AAV7VUK7_PLEWA|nr:hypothetical protein NDU88_007762 [Pleurodeles waltl]